MSSMSTPVNQLPTNISNEVIKENIHQLEDMSIANVINEMEKQVQRPLPQQDVTNVINEVERDLQRNPPQKQFPTQATVQHVYQQQYPIQQMPPQFNQTQQYAQQGNQFQQSASQQPSGTLAMLYSLVNLSYVRYSLLVAVIAALMFYPFDTSFIYDRIPFSFNIEQYDRIIRTIVFAVILYAILIKLRV